jgi:hypothetical protein
MGNQKGPLRRGYVPTEHKTSVGNSVFRTMDRDAYVRDGETGVIRRMHPKVKKKQRRKHASA